MLKKFSRFSTRFIAVPSPLRTRIHTRARTVYMIDKYVTLQRTLRQATWNFFLFSPPCPFILDTYPSFGSSTGFTDRENNSREIDLRPRSVHLYRDSPAIVPRISSNDPPVSWNIIGRVGIFIHLFWMEKRE